MKQYGEYMKETEALLEHLDKFPFGVYEGFPILHKATKQADVAEWIIKFYDLRDKSSEERKP